MTALHDAAHMLLDRNTAAGVANEVSQTSPRIGHSRHRRVAGTMCGAGRFLDMSGFEFDPPVVTKSQVIVATLDDAAFCVRTFHARRPSVQESVLHRIEGASTEEEQRDAAHDFLAWAKAEGLLARQ